LRAGFVQPVPETGYRSPLNGGRIIARLRFSVSHHALQVSNLTIYFTIGGLAYLP
jgi:hypothetical protein